MEGLDKNIDSLELEYDLCCNSRIVEFTYGRGGK